MIIRTNKLTSVAGIIAVTLSWGAESASISSPVLMENRADHTAAISANEGNTELFFMVEQLAHEVVTLRGLVEELQHTVSVLQKQNRERYIDVDRRIQELSGSVPKRSGVAPVGGSVSSDGKMAADSFPAAGITRLSPNQIPFPEPGAQERRAYEAAYNLVKEKSFDDAIDALHGFIERYPDGNLAGNAYYWLGEVYLAADKLEQAKAAFTVVVNKFPNHRKTADAYYKLGAVYLKLGKKNKALVYLDKVISRFAETSASRLASKLKKESF
ncbi:MAG: tol-pal system protein YbgF [Gammaproteobacteria bacterium]|nr:MAG: tol-pal system protein YbgF [Gammaproteobacteria bacterium]